MKRTFVFCLDRHDMTASKMNALYKALSGNYSHTVDRLDGRVTRLRVSMEPREMYTIARFIGISQEALYEAFQPKTGTPVSEVALPDKIEAYLRQLHGMGCEIDVKRISPSRFRIAFGGVIWLTPESPCRSFLYGVLQGFSAARSQFNDVLSAIENIDRSVEIRKIIQAARRDPSEPGSPKLTSALKTLRKPMAKVIITRRSKRSC